MCLAVSVIDIFPDFGEIDIYYFNFPLCFAKNNMVLESFLEYTVVNCFGFVFYVWDIWILGFDSISGLRNEM